MMWSSTCSLFAAQPLSLISGIPKEFLQNSLPLAIPFDWKLTVLWRKATAVFGKITKKDYLKAILPVFVILPNFYPLMQ